MVSNMLRRPTEMVRRKTAVARQTGAQSSQQPREDHTKPFTKISFYLDLKDYHFSNNLTNDIKTLGGTVETFLSKDVNYVVTNRLNWKQQLKNGVLDDGSLPSTPNSHSNTKSGVSPCNLESPKDRNVPKIVTSRASAMLEKARQSATKGSSDVLQIARLWGVKVVSLPNCLNIIKRSKSQQAHQRPHSTKVISKMKLKPPSVIKFTYPFVKFEDTIRAYRPQYRQFREWPVLNLDSRHSRSPFAKPVSKKSIQGDDDLPQKDLSSSIPIQENSLQKYIAKKESSRSVKEVVSTVTQPLNSNSCTENNKIEVLTKPGFCEMCITRYEDVYAHIQTKEHQKYLKKPGLYAAVDKKIATLPDIYTFAKMALQSLLEARSKSSDSAVTDKKRNVKENFSMPMPKPAYRKRKQHVDPSQPLRKKRKALLATNASNTENCSNENSHLTTSEQCGESPTKVRNSKNAENVDVFRDSVVIKLPSNSTGSVPSKRNVLQSLDQNAITPINTGACQSENTQKCSPEIRGKNTDFDKKPEAIRVLRSTAIRRISASNTLTRSASSPSFRSLVLADLCDSRKTKSSPNNPSLTKKNTSFLGACRALDLGVPCPGDKRQSFLEATQKLRNLAAESQDDVRSDMPCLEAVLDTSNNEALSDMPFLKCMAPISPLKPDASPQPVPVTPTRDIESELNRVLGFPETSECTNSSQKPTENPVADCVEATRMSDDVPNQEPIGEIKEVENGSNSADSCTKEDEFASPAKFRHPADRGIPKTSRSRGDNSDSGDPLTSTSSSSVFNLISSPVLQNHSKTCPSTDSAVNVRSENSIPKFVFRRIHSDKHTQWTLSILSDGLGTVNSPN